MSTTVGTAVNMSPKGAIGFLSHPRIGLPRQKHEASRCHNDPSYDKLAGPNGDFAVPTLEALGFPVPTPKHRGGETVALEILDAIIVNETYTVTFEKPKNGANSI